MGPAQLVKLLLTGSVEPRSSFGGANMQNDTTLDLELKRALAQLERSFDSLAETRDQLGSTLDTALWELTRRIEHIDQTLNADDATRAAPWPNAA